MRYFAHELFNDTHDTWHSWPTFENIFRKIIGELFEDRNPFYLPLQSQKKWQKTRRARETG